MGASFARYHICGKWKGWFSLCIMQERAAKCRVAYRFLCCHRGPCSPSLAESSSHYVPLLDSAWCMWAAFSTCHTNPELILALLHGGQLVFNFELLHTIDINDSYGWPLCWVCVTEHWHHVGREYRPKTSDGDLTWSLSCAFVIMIIKSSSHCCRPKVSSQSWLFFLNNKSAA